MSKNSSPDQNSVLEQKLPILNDMIKVDNSILKTVDNFSQWINQYQTIITSFVKCIHSYKTTDFSYDDRENKISQSPDILLVHQIQDFSPIQENFFDSDLSNHDVPLRQSIKLFREALSIYDTHVSQNQEQYQRIETQFKSIVNEYFDSRKIYSLIAQDIERTQQKIQKNSSQLKLLSRFQDLKIDFKKEECNVCDEFYKRCVQENDLKIQEEIILTEIEKSEKQIYNAIFQIGNDFSLQLHGVSNARKIISSKILNLMHEIIEIRQALISWLNDDFSEVTTQGPTISFDIEEFLKE